MQAGGVALGGPQTVKVPPAAVAFGVPITRRVYCPTAAGSASVAVFAVPASAVVPTIEAPWVTTTLAALSAAGVLRSVNVTSRSGCVEPDATAAIVNVS